MSNSDSKSDDDFSHKLKSKHISSSSSSDGENVVDKVNSKSVEIDEQINIPNVAKHHQIDEELGKDHSRNNVIRLVSVIDSDTSDDEDERNAPKEKIVSKTEFGGVLNDNSRSDSDADIDTCVRDKKGRSTGRDGGTKIVGKRIKKSTNNENNLKEIQAESNRLLRETRINLPYRRARHPKSLKEFLDRKKNRPDVFGTLAMKGRNVDVEVIDKLVELREKDAAKFYSSEDDESDNHESFKNDSKMEACVDEAIRQEGEEGANCENSETKCDNTDSKKLDLQDDIIYTPNADSCLNIHSEPDSISQKASAISSSKHSLISKFLSKTSSKTNDLLSKFPVISPKLSGLSRSNIENSDEMIVLESDPKLEDFKSRVAQHFSSHNSLINENVEKSTLVESKVVNFKALKESLNRQIEKRKHVELERKRKAFAESNEEEEYFDRNNEENGEVDSEDELDVEEMEQNSDNDSKTEFLNDEAEIDDEEINDIVEQVENNDKDNFITVEDGVENDLLLYDEESTSTVILSEQKSSSKIFGEEGDYSETLEGGVVGSTAATQMNFDALAGLCSGQFDVPIVDDESESEGHSSDDEHELNELEHIGTKSSLKQHSQYILRDDEEMNDETLSRKRARIEYSSDEGEDIKEESRKSDNDESLSDSETEMEEEEVLDNENIIDSDSGDEETELAQKVLFEKREKVSNEFFENEAELSGSDVGSGDEDEDGDYSDMEDLIEKDFEVKDEVRLREEVGKIHHNREFEEHKREVRVLQEAFLDDGEFHTDVQRTRQFKWSNIDDDMENGDDNVSGNESEHEDEIDEEAEKLNHQTTLKNLWIQESMIKSSMSDATSNDVPVVNDNSEITDGLFFADKSLSNANNISNGAKNDDEISESKVRRANWDCLDQPLQRDISSSNTNTHSIHTRLKHTKSRGSFLSRSSLALSKISSSIISSETSSTTSLQHSNDNRIQGVRKQSTNFLFHVMSPETAAIVKKRKSAHNDDGPQMDSACNDVTNTFKPPLIISRRAKKKLKLDDENAKTNEK